MLNENVREDDWPDIFTNDFQVIAERKAKTSFREKKDLSTLINEYPARLEEGDPIWPGAVYSGRCQIAIGVSGFAKAESDEGIARLISFIPKRN